MNVLTIGGAMLDTIVTIASDKIEQMKMRNAESSFLLLEEGLKTEADHIATQCGGGAVNAAVAAARLGHATSAIVKVGRDDKAKTILGRLGEEGVDLEWISVDDEAPTGASVIISSHDRNAAVFTYRGANTRLKAADFPGRGICKQGSRLRRQSQQRVGRPISPHRRTREGGERAARCQSGGAAAHRAFR